MISEQAGGRANAKCAQWLGTVAPCGQTIEPWGRLRGSPGGQSGSVSFESLHFPSMQTRPLPCQRVRSALKNASFLRSGSAFLSSRTAWSS